MSAAKIMLVDDEPDMELLVSQKFRRKVRDGELTFVFASDGQHALEMLEKEPGIEIVFTDINMPRMDGLTLLERLNELNDELRTVVISAYGDMSNIRTAMNRGAFDFLTKPIEFDDLETTLEKTLRHQRLLKSLREDKMRAERDHLTLSRFFSPRIVETLARFPDSLSPRGEWRTATYVFTDLADFTPLVEASDPAIIVDLLNNYIDGLTQVVFDHGGSVMKVIGDSIHAVFGAPIDEPDHAARAVRCALALDEYAMRFKQEQNDAGIPLGVTRIGINTGSAIIGSFGGRNFFDYTAYGDAVNIASRLEKANKVVGTRICAGADVVSRITSFTGRPVGDLRLKGKSRPLRCFEPLTDEAANSSAMVAYDHAFTLLESGDDGARQAFASLLGQALDDPLTNFHLRRLLAGETGVEIQLD